ncbi:MAG TPA: xanthine dehydrogenase family protein molybdopterin-binding subunit, partial [Thermoanaerobaculia bacterium]|nr:xanthine dehydrogenase family protein molybdopterin-binding subunit [Thermoanaerobaculia bacterium]
MVDGPARVSGTARYPCDLRFPGMLYARFVRCPHAHARVTRIDVSAARAMRGVKAIHVVQAEGTEVHWALDEVVAIAAVSEPVAADAVRAVKVEYE